MSIHTIEDFTTWLQGKPHDEIFPYFSKTNCCYGQYLQDRGFIDFVVGGTYYELKGIKYPLNPAIAIAIADSDWTFGSVYNELINLQSEKLQ